MLDIAYTEMREGFLQYLPVGGLIGLVLLAELAMIAGTWVFAPVVAANRAFPTPAVAEISNTHAIGNILYTDYIYLFQAAGLVLLVAMIGAIVLTLRSRPGIRRQKIADQLGRRADQAVEIRKIEPGNGI